MLVMNEAFIAEIMYITRLSGLFFFQQRRYLHTPNKSPQKAFYCLNIYALIGYSFHILS